MEFVQFHPTGCLAASVKGILVTESVGRRRRAAHSDGKRFMFEYIPDVFKDK